MMPHISAEAIQTNFFLSKETLQVTVGHNERTTDKQVYNRMNY